MSKLAILGGSKIRTKPLPRFSPLGIEESAAVQRVMNSGVLSKYIGAWDPDFMGGVEVQSFEKEWASKFKARYAVAVNSNSSGIHAALGAVGIGYGDEVIVSPYSMAVSASAPLVWNAVPVFADIDPENYCISAAEFERRITTRTKALVIVHIFGCPADMDEIMLIARKHGIAVIEDCAQAPGALYKGKPVGTLGDIGVFSLNYHKHIHTGEGGMCVTNNAALANKLQLIRNHAEAVVEAKGDSDLVNMIGFNFRLTELQAAIGREQLKRLDREVELRQEQAKVYDNVISAFPFLGITSLHQRTHAYYVQAFRFDEAATGVSRDIFIEAVCRELAPVQGREDEGVPIYGGYVKPLYLLPMFQKKIAYKNGFPFRGDEHYEKGICPVVEKMHYSQLWTHDLTRSPLTESDVKDVASAYEKVAENISSLRGFQP